MNRSDSTNVPARFIVGIDLGTTNSAVAYVDANLRGAQPTVFPVVQFVGPGEVEARETLPSFHYTPAQGEFAQMRLPWEKADSKYLVGMLARDHGAGVPGRLVVSAKSWLSHSGVDRTANLLPWHGAPDIEKLSPTEVSARYLGHIRSAWNHRWPEHPLENQDVVITIPASFDEIARELTVAAAQRAGLPRIVLIEEPQAAFYAWISAQGSRWNAQLLPGQKILVCDVGGGTTDFTLIQVRRGENDRVNFHRVAVGEHLILGGDNLDVALAHFIEQRLTGGGRLAPREWGVLVRRCQQAKETLLGRDAPERITINLPSGGSRLIGGAQKTEVTREEVRELLIDGFMPRVTFEEVPAKHSSGFQEFGLPYAPDHAITRYLAAFLKAHASPAQTIEAARPDVLLCNGGLFESPEMRLRLIEVLQSWFTEAGASNPWSPLVLNNERLDLAVALGAAYYGLVRRGLGVRISGGLPRSYYIGVTRHEKPAALCLVPAGLEEGQEVELKEQHFDLLIRQPVEFPIFVSSARTTDKPGDLVKFDATQLSALPPIRTVLQAGKKSAPSASLPVHLHARLTEIGTLEVWCSEVNGHHRWKLQFDIRAATQTDVSGHAGTAERAGFVEEEVAQKCSELVRRAFLSRKDPIPPENLAKLLETELAMRRLDWPPSLLRRIWEELMNVEEGRVRSVSHEARWLNLLGFALRPGFGFAVDDWRVAQTWQLHAKKVHHSGNELCRAEWWILWRRIAGGLVAGQQRVLAEPLLSALRSRERTEKAKETGPRSRTSTGALFKFGAHETQEVWRLLGSLELLNPDLKSGLGEMLLAQVTAKGLGAIGGAALWSLGRLGTRVPLHGPLNSVVPAEVVERWAERLISLSGDAEGAIFPIVEMARRTGDRYRDISEALRERVLAWLSKHAALEHHIELVRAGGELHREEENLVFGEILPQGLRLR